MNSLLAPQLFFPPTAGKGIVPNSQGKTGSYPALSNSNRSLSCHFTRLAEVQRLSSYSYFVTLHRPLLFLPFTSRPLTTLWSRQICHAKRFLHTPINVDTNPGLSLTTGGMRAVCCRRRLHAHGGIPVVYERRRVIHFHHCSLTKTTSQAFSSPFRTCLVKILHNIHEFLKREKTMKGSKSVS